MIPAAEAAIIDSLFNPGGTKTNFREEKFSSAKFSTHPLGREIDVKGFDGIVSLFYKNGKDVHGDYYQV